MVSNVIPAAASGQETDGGKRVRTAKGETLGGNKDAPQLR